jgi:hypothetical protein
VVRHKSRMPPVGLELYNNGNLQHNTAITANSRVFAALVGGIVAGAGDITGAKGFAVFLAFQLLNALIMFGACRGDPKRFFKSHWSIFFSGIVSQTELLTFILLWTLTHNLCYLF